MPLSTTTKGTIIRNMIADFLNVGTPVEPKWVLMGAGFTALDENPNAQAETRAYVSDRTASSVIRGYEAQFPFTTDLMSSEEAINSIYAIGRNQLQAQHAERAYVRVEGYLATSEPNTHPARLFRVSVEVTDVSGEGTNIVEISGNLNVVGDFVPGVFNIVTKEFTPLTEWTGEPLKNDLYYEPTLPETPAPEEFSLFGK